MSNINMVKLGSNEFKSSPSLHSDVIFAIPLGQEVRGVGLDPSNGLFVILRSGREKIYPVITTGNGKDITSLKMVAVELVDMHDTTSIEEVCRKFMRHDA